MNTCRNGVCHKPGREYAYALGRKRTHLCDDCHRSLTGIGMSLTAIEPDTRPEWIRRGIEARETTGLVAA